MVVAVELRADLDRAAGRALLAVDVDNVGIGALVGVGVCHPCAEVFHLRFARTVIRDIRSVQIERDTLCRVAHILEVALELPKVHNGIFLAVEFLLIEVFKFLFTQVKIKAAPIAFACFSGFHRFVNINREGVKNLFALLIGGYLELERDGFPVLVEGALLALDVLVYTAENPVGFQCVRRNLDQSGLSCYLSFKRVFRGAGSLVCDLIATVAKLNLVGCLDGDACANVQTIFQCDFVSINRIIVAADDVQITLSACELVGQNDIREVQLAAVSYGDLVLNHVALFDFYLRIGRIQRFAVTGHVCDGLCNRQPGHSLVIKLEDVLLRLQNKIAADSVALSIFVEHIALRFIGGFLGFRREVIANLSIRLSAICCFRRIATVCLHQVIRNGKRCVCGLVLCEGPLAVERLAALGHGVRVSGNLGLRAEIIVRIPADEGPLAFVYSISNLCEAARKRYVGTCFHFVAVSRVVLAQDILRKRRDRIVAALELIAQLVLRVHGHAGPPTDEGHVLIAHRVGGASHLNTVHMPAGEGVRGAANLLRILLRVANSYRIACVISGAIRIGQVLLQIIGQTSFEFIRNAVRFFNRGFVTNVFVQRIH